MFARPYMERAVVHPACEACANGFGAGVGVGRDRVMALWGRRGGLRARYRVRDWAAYDRSLVRRGDITVSVSPEAVAGWRAPAGRRTFSDAAIAAALTVRAVYQLALR